MEKCSEWYLSFYRLWNWLLGTEEELLLKNNALVLGQLNQLLSLIGSPAELLIILPFIKCVLYSSTNAATNKWDLICSELEGLQNIRELICKCIDTHLLFFSIKRRNCSKCRKAQLVFCSETIVVKAEDFLWWLQNDGRGLNSMWRGSKGYMSVVRNSWNSLGFGSMLSSTVSYNKVVSRYEEFGN